ncbi:LrgB family protein [Deinococcus maricopensis]|uniref:LrgB family protein n=1 Tax=Deinococcus maricopensis (strain DSM 21211 / LMG 22137 / NRRL B-23946 / LB-34) TaxID=709986 RepID=E8U7I2_DEIML|nr:LrgB family protein [Deinococcus maricopensis]ADV67021.1 LrgB family protein [Deinococcus maricopensis DSM 21211]
MTFLALTLLAYALGVTVQGRWRTPLAHPTLVASVLLAAVLLLTGTPYAQYARDTSGLTALLSPAVVALAVPLHRQRALLRRAWRSLLLGGAAGTLTALLVNVVGAWALGVDRTAALALRTDAATSPVAVALAPLLGGSGALAAVLAVLSGLMGALLLPAWLSRLGVRHPLARGVALGSVAHGVGTARAREEGEETAAASSVGMGLGAILVTLAVAFTAR